MIVPPVVLEDRDGYLAIYDAVDEAIANLDLDDVIDREFSAYDSRGCLLSVEASTEPERMATIELVDEVPSHEDQLRTALLRALRLAGVGVSYSTENLPLEQLLGKALRHKRGNFLP